MERSSLGLGGWKGEYGWGRGGGGGGGGGREHMD